MTALLKRTAKIKIGSTVFGERTGWNWIEENVDPRSNIDQVFTIEPIANMERIYLVAPFYGSFERNAAGELEYGSGSLMALSLDLLDIQPWHQLTEDEVCTVMLERHPLFHIPSFEIKQGKLSDLTRDINASIIPFKVMDDFQKGRRTRRVVCAANRITHESFEGGSLVIASARHYQGDVRKLYRELGAAPGGSRGVKPADTKGGFIDQWEEFMTREEAFKVATLAGQPIDMERNGHDFKLFSEGLY